MDEQHPIPQQISTYQFRLVGDMTLKQFMQVAGGALIALLIYTSNLPGYIRWPLVLVSFLLGVALAFVPLQDRPLSKWILLFFKSIYSPTVYVWKKVEQKPQYFKSEAAATPAPAQDVQAATAQAQQAMPDESDQPPEAKELEEKEKQFLTQVTEQFKGNIPQITPTSTTQEEVKREAETKMEVEVPKDQPTQVDKTEKIEEKTVFSQQQPQQTSDIQSQVTPMQGQQSQPTSQATFSEEAGPPSPTKPNVVVGQVLSPEGKIIDNAILEIKDSDGRSVRAIKTNKLGHFMIVTPLANGSYKIDVEKEGFDFEPITFQAKGEIIRPIEIRAKSRTNQ